MLDYTASAAPVCNLLKTLPPGLARCLLPVRALYTSRLKVSGTLTQPSTVSFLPLSASIVSVRCFWRLCLEGTRDTVRTVTLSMVSSDRDPDTQQVWSASPADGTSFACSNSHATPPRASSACKSCANQVARKLLAPPPPRQAGRDTKGPGRAYSPHQTTSSRAVGLLL